MRILERSCFYYCLLSVLWMSLWLPVARLVQRFLVCAVAISDMWAVEVVPGRARVEMVVVLCCVVLLCCLVMLRLCCCRCLCP